MISQPLEDIYLSNTYVEFDLDLNQIGWQYGLHRIAIHGLQLCVPIYVTVPHSWT